jgi:hypothetical protein
MGRNAFGHDPLVIGLLRASLAFLLAHAVPECLAQSVSFLSGTYTVQAGSSVSVSFRFETPYANTPTYVWGNGDGHNVGDSWSSNFREQDGRFLQKSGVYVFGTFWADIHSGGEVLTLTLDAPPLIPLRS